MPSAPFRPSLPVFTLAAGVTLSHAIRSIRDRLHEGEEILKRHIDVNCEAATNAIYIDEGRWVSATQETLKALFAEPELGRRFRGIEFARGINTPQGKYRAALEKLRPRFTRLDDILNALLDGA